MTNNHSPVRRNGMVRCASVGCCLACLTTLRVVGAEADAEAVAAPEKKSKWQTSAGVGFTLTSGNSESILVTLGVETHREWKRSKLMMGAFGGYGEARGVNDTQMQKNQDYLRGYAQYNWDLTARLYAYGRVDADHDDIADLMYRVKASPGVGYYFIKTPKTTLTGEVGPGYTWEKLGDEVNDYPTVRLAERFEHKFSDSARVWESADFTPEVTDWENFVLSAELGAEADLTKKLAIRVLLQDTYVSRPAPDRKKNDLKLVSGLQYKF